MAATLLLRPSPTPITPTVRHLVLKDLDRVETYPTLSDTAVRLLGLTERDDISVAEVAAIVRRDGVLTVRVLRAANSCMFRGRNEVEDVQQAVLRMGVQQCAQLLGAAGLRKIYERYAPAVRERCDVLLRHSLFVGRFASGLARLATVCPPGPAFTAGLLHDIGRIVFCVNINTAQTNLPDVYEGEDALAAERAAYSVDHCAVGYQFATCNNLPESVARVVLNHHRPAEERLQRTLVALVAVAERVTNHVQRKHNITGYDLGACPAFRVLSRDWGQARIDVFRAGLASATVQALRDTRHMLKSIA